MTTPEAVENAGTANASSGLAQSDVSSSEEVKASTARGKPKIFVFCTGRVPADLRRGTGANILNRLVGKAVAEDGTELGGRFSSTTRWLKLDMGIHSSCGLHEKYAAHYPNGYELVWLDEPDASPELRAAVKRAEAAK